MNISDEDATDQKVEEKINELRAKYPIFGGVLERENTLNGSKGNHYSIVWN